MKSSLGYVLGERMNMILNVTTDTSVSLCSKVFQPFLICHLVHCTGEHSQG